MHLWLKSERLFEVFKFYCCLIPTESIPALHVTSSFDEKVEYYWSLPFCVLLMTLELGFLGGSAVKNLPASPGDMGAILGSGGSPGEGNGNPFHYSCLENPMDRGAWWATVHRVAKSWIILSD